MNVVAIKPRAVTKIQTSEMAILSVEAELSSLNKENEEIYNKNEVITDINTSSRLDKVEC